MEICVKETNKVKFVSPLCANGKKCHAVKTWFSQLVHKGERHTSQYAAQEEILAGVKYFDFDVATSFQLHKKSMHNL